MSVVAEIEQLARPIVEAKGAFLVEASLRGNGRNQVLELFVDTDTGVTTDTCAEISRELSQTLDQANVIRGSYHLVVSSPGLDRPLQLPRQYPRNVGRKVTVTYKLDAERKTAKGILEDVTAGSFAVRTEGKAPELLSIAYDDVIEVRVHPPF